jgi:CRISPR type III-B/RAMP module-associated protein Cmr5
MSLDRGVATMARELVESQQQSTPDHVAESEYRSLCESLPILLRTAGLTRTVTFLEAKGKEDRSGQSNKEGVLLDHLRRQLLAMDVYSNPKQRSLELPCLVTSKDLSTPDYRHISSLAFRVAYWHKRLAQALLRQRECGR